MQLGGQRTTKEENSDRKLPLSYKFSYIPSTCMCVRTGVGVGVSVSVGVQVHFFQAAYRGGESRGGARSVRVQRAGELARGGVSVVYS